MFVKHVYVYDIFNQIILSLVLKPIAKVMWFLFHYAVLRITKEKSENLTRTVGASATRNSYGSPQAESHCN